MSDTYNPLGWFLPNKDPNVDAATRKQIALAMMARSRKAYPKTLGEGIASIGENIGDALAYRAMLAENAAENKGNAAFVGQFTGGAQPQAATENAQPDSAPLAAAAASVAPSPSPITPPQPAQTRIIRPAPIPPPDGTPGNTGATTFQPPFQPPPGAPQQSPKLPPLPTQAAIPTAAPVMAQGGAPAAVPPDEEARRGVAHALLRQQGGAPPPAPPRPAVADFGQPSALAPTPPQAISAAPPVAPVRAAPQPQQQTAQTEEFPPGYVMPERSRTQPPPLMTPLQQQIEARLQAEPPATQAARRAAVEPILARERAKVAQAHEEWKSQQIQDRALEIEREKQKVGSAAAKVEYGAKTSEAVTKATEARIVDRTGMKPQELYDRLDKDKASVDQTLKAQSAQQLARKAIRDGVITGYGAGTALVGAKFADWAWGNGLKGDLAANTETMSAMLKSGLSEAIKTVNGEGGVGVSNTDVRIAEGMTGSDPQLQLKTIKSIMDRAAEINHRKIGSYEDNVDRYLSGEPAEHRYKTGGSTVPPDKLKLLLENPEQMKSKFDEVYGPGAANLEINRFKRAQSRRGRD